VATYPYDGRRTSELLAVADANLYRSKRDGGNRVTASDIEETRAGAPPEPTL
jgi:GGDEF domain-containing protein